MSVLDNLRDWDRFKIYRYLVLLALSLAGDGWSVMPLQSSLLWLTLGRMSPALSLLSFRCQRGLNIWDMIR